MAPRDYYDILGVPRSATPDQIKSAYRKLARKHHPDVSKAKDAADKFKEATAAYEVLSDPQKRPIYDQFGHAGPGGMGGAGGFSGGRRPSGPRAQTWSYGPGGQGVPFDFDDQFSSSPFAGMSLEELLGSLGGRGRGRRGGPAPTGGNLEYPMTLDFLQAARGTTATLQFESPDGTPERIEVKIPAGVREGSKVRVRGKGNMGPGGAGDLHIICHVREHPYFRREGNDIYVDLPVSVTEAALGGTASVPTIDGPATLKIPAGASSGTRLRLSGKGVSDPKTGVRGDQYAVLKIMLPKPISAKGQELLKQFAQSDPYDPREKVAW